jgi:hypothetical protein
VPLVVVLVRVILVVLSVQVRPPVVAFVRLTVPVNPAIPVTVIVDVPGEFASTFTVVGLAVTVKSATL